MMHDGGGYPERDGAAAAAVGLGQEFYGVGMSFDTILSQIKAYTTIHIMQ